MQKSLAQRFAMFVCSLVRTANMCVSDRNLVIYLRLQRRCDTWQRLFKSRTTQNVRFFFLSFFSLPLAPPLARNTIELIPLQFCFPCVSLVLSSLFFLSHSLSSHIIIIDTQEIFHIEKPFECMTFFSLSVPFCRLFV